MSCRKTLWNETWPRTKNYQVFPDSTIFQNIIGLDNLATQINIVTQTYDAGKINFNLFIFLRMIIKRNVVVKISNMMVAWPRCEYIFSGFSLLKCFKHLYNFRQEYWTINAQLKGGFTQFSDKSNGSIYTSIFFFL